MTRGGSRNRSGPSPDPNSQRSERRGYSVTALPAEGFDGTPPEWPLPERKVFYSEKDSEGATVRVFDKAATRQVAERELELWAWAWSTPQACAWSMPAESWRLQTIAMWVRTMVVCEGSEATAADKNSLHRFADQVGMTPAGLRENGWAVARDVVGERSAEKKAAAPKAKSSRDRMKVVNGGGS